MLCRFRCIFSRSRMSRTHVWSLCSRRTEEKKHKWNPVQKCVWYYFQRKIRQIVSASVAKTRIHINLTCADLNSTGWMLHWFMISIQIISVEYLHILGLCLYSEWVSSLCYTYIPYTYIYMYISVLSWTWRWVKMFRNLFDIGDKQFSLYLYCARDKQVAILESLGHILQKTYSVLFQKRQDNTEKQLLPSLLCLKVGKHNKSRSRLSTINTAKCSYSFTEVWVGITILWLWPRLKTLSNKSN